jgi:hypothetical protein
MAWKRTEPNTGKTAPPKLKIKPLWDLYRDGVTQGSLRRFRTCPEQFYLHYVEGWSAKSQSDAIAFGDAFHNVLSEVHQGRSINNATDRYKKQSIVPKMTASMREDLETLCGQIRVVTDAYMKFWHKDKKKRKWIAREKKFSTGYGAALNIPLKGRWDGLYEEGKKLWLHETKTKSQIDELSIPSLLPFDLQTMLYCYTAEQTYGKKIAGTVYDCVRRPGLRRGAKETLKDFLARTKADIANRPKHYFMRWEVSLSSTDVSRWVEHQLRPRVLELVRWWEDIKPRIKEGGSRWDSPLHFIDDAGLVGRYGRCDLFFAITQQNYHNLYRRKVIYPELQGE